VRCPNLTDEGSCGVYQERYKDGMPDLVMVGRYTSRKFVDLKGAFIDRPFMCGRIEQLLQNPTFPEEIKRQCCYHDPSLLERV
jgi:hypothetical protein